VWPSWERRTIVQGFCEFTTGKEKLENQDGKGLRRNKALASQSQRSRLGIITQEKSRSKLKGGSGEKNNTEGLKRLIVESRHPGWGYRGRRLSEGEQKPGKKWKSGLERLRGALWELKKSLNSETDWVTRFGTWSKAS